MSELNERGHEVLDPRPKTLDVPFRRPEPIHMRLRRMILETINQQHDGYETFEEADDFEVGDVSDFEDRNTPYEEHFDHISQPPPAPAPAPAPAPEPASPEKINESMPLK